MCTHLHVHILLHIYCTGTHEQSQINENGKAKLDSITAEIEKALAIGDYTLATKLWGQSEATVENVRMFVCMCVYVSMCGRYMSLGADKWMKNLIAS